MAISTVVLARSPREVQAAGTPGAGTGTATVADAERRHAVERTGSPAAPADPLPGQNAGGGPRAQWASSRLGSRCEPALCSRPGQQRERADCGQITRIVSLPRGRRRGCLGGKQSDPRVTRSPPPGALAPPLLCRASPPPSRTSRALTPLGPSEPPLNKVTEYVIFQKPLKEQGHLGPTTQFTQITARRGHR